MSALSLGTRREAGRTVVSLTGDLDPATVPTLREAALAELTAADCKILVLDLNGVRDELSDEVSDANPDETSAT